MITIKEISNIYWTRNLKQSGMAFELPTPTVMSEVNGRYVNILYGDLIFFFSDIQVESSLYDIALFVCIYICFD